MQVWQEQVLFVSGVAQGMVALGTLYRLDIKLSNKFGHSPMRKNKTALNGREKIIAVLCAGSVVCCALGFWGAPAIETNYIFRWGEGTPNVLTGQRRCHIQVMGLKLARFKSDYKAVGACFIAAGDGDISDMPLSKSSPIDIADDLFEIRIPWDQDYMRAIAAGLTGTNYVLLLVPNGVTSDKFETLRQAKALGALQMDAHAGPP